MGILGKIEASSQPPETKASDTWPALAMQSGGGITRLMNRRFIEFATEGYKKNVIAYRCISMVAQSVASVPFKVMRDEVEILDGELVDLVARPNPWTGWGAFIESMVAYYLIAGDAYLEAVAPKGQVPSELYTLRPDRMHVKMSQLFGSPEAYVWIVGNARKVWDMDPITGEGPILHWRSFNPMDPWNGQSAVDPASFSIDQHNAAATHNARLLRNNATPSGALSFGSNKEGGSMMTPEQRAFLRNQLDRYYSGAENAGRVLILEDGMTWTSMGLSQKDMDWLKGKDVSAREIGLAYGVPSQLLSIPDSQTYANNREARLAFWEDTVIPLLSRCRDALNVWFAQWWPEFRLEYDLAEVPAMALQQERKGERLTKLVQGYIFTPNEAREEFGKEPSDGGDALLTPAGLLPINFGGPDRDEDADDDAASLVTANHAEEGRLAYGKNGAGQS